MSDTATEEKTDQTEKTEEETNELGAEEEVSKEAIETADEIASILEDDETEEDEVEDEKIEGEETEEKETSEKTEDDDKAKAEEKDAGQVEQKDAEIDDSLLQRATDAGMSITQARSFKSKDDLETSVSFAETQKASHAKAVENNSDAKAAEKKQDEEEVKVERVNLDELLGKDYDEDLVKPLNEAFGKMSDQIEQLTKDFKGVKEENALLRSSVDDRETNSALDDFDERIGKLPEEFKEVFGEGNFDSLAKTSKEHGQRSQVLSEMAAMSAGYTASKQPMPPIQTLLERAVFNVTGKTVTGKQSEKVADDKKEKIKADLKKRADGTIGKPNGGKVKDQTNAGKLIASANAVTRLLDGK